MPTTALKNLAKRAKVSPDRAEHLWKKAKGIVASEYGKGEDDPSFWALRMGITKKMLGLSETLTFKQFLEAAVGKEPEYKSIDVEKAHSLLNKHCKDALWMLHEDRPLYRGEKQRILAVTETGFAVVDTAATERTSQNTSNYYTILLDNHPDRNDFPKRSRCFVATTNQGRASGYSWGGDGEVMVIIPMDGVKIGVVGHSDMWETSIDLFGHTDDIETYNSMFAKIGLKPDVDDFEEFGHRLANGNTEALARFKKAFTSADMNFQKHGFMEQIWNAYSAKATGHIACTTKTFPAKFRDEANDTEVWVGGKVVVMTRSMWDKIRGAYKNER